VKSLRVLRHLCTPLWVLRLRYPQSLQDRIAARIGEVERQHPGELRFAVEHALELGDLLAGLTPRERALELFGLLRVWDTEHNNGVLIYVLHAEHAVEIIADRGLARCVPQADWDALCRCVETEFRAGNHGQGALAAIDGAARLLEQHFPARVGGRNELPDQPLLL
jgi:TPM domain